MVVKVNGASSWQVCKATHAFLVLSQEGEDPTLSQPITENLNAILQLLQYQEVGPTIMVA